MDTFKNKLLNISVTVLVAFFTIICIYCIKHSRHGIDLFKSDFTGTYVAYTVEWILIVRILQIMSFPKLAFK